MPRAAPGDNANGAVRRKFPKSLEGPGNQSARNPMTYPYRSEKESCSHHSIKGISKVCTFIQLLSVYRVECGRLGKVVSTVGDCRPPPPGNPHLLTTSRHVVGEIIGRQEDSRKVSGEDINIAPQIQRDGGFSFQVWLRFSFNNREKPSNLKILNSSEYFKNNCSYYYCTEKKAVLEFGSFSLPHMRVNGSENPTYSHYKCSRNAGIIYALPIL
jgi:hypothetical protein